MLKLSPRIDRIKPSPSSMAGQRVRELRAAGRDVVGLTSGEPDFPTPDHVIDAAHRAMRDGKTRYTDVGGTPELRSAVRDKFKRENGLDYALNEIIVGTGGKQVIFNALMATVDLGDEVIVPAPYWVSYPDIVLLAGGTPVFVETPSQGGFKLSPEELERAITPRTRWVVLNAPNNPSGAAYTRAEMQALADVLLRHPDIWVLCDDIYEHILYDGREFVTMAQVEPRMRERTVTMNGCSKAYAMTGWRIGYAGAPAELIRAMVKLQSQSTSGTSSVSQAAALAALTGPQEIVRERTAVFQDRRDAVVRWLNAAPGLHCHVPEGAFYAFPSCAGALGRRTPEGKRLDTAEDLVMHLLDAHDVAVLPGTAYGVPPFFRLSFATSLDVLEEGCRRIARACAALAD